MQAYQSARVGRVWWVVLEKTGKSKVWHFTHQIAVDQDVARS